MPFDLPVQGAVDNYARADLDGDLDQHIGKFDFLADDPDLQQRVGEEYFTARYLYKLWEGLRIDETWANRAQVQLQVQQYASIYEACLHHVLFTECASEPEVQALLEQPTLKPWSVATELEEQLASLPTENGRTVKAAITSVVKLEASRVRFEHKADASVQLKILQRDLADELKEFYSARNMIHIHAEMRKGANWDWQMEFARDAYRRLDPFCAQIRGWRLSRLSLDTGSQE